MKCMKPKSRGRLMRPKVGIMSLDIRGSKVLDAVLENAPKNTIKHIGYTKSDSDLKKSLNGIKLLFVTAEYLEKKIFDIFYIAESIGVFCVLSLPEYAKDGAYYKKIAVLLSKDNDSIADEAKKIISICNFYSAEYNKDKNNITYDVGDMRDMMQKAYTSLVYCGSLEDMPSFIKHSNIAYARGIFVCCVYNGSIDLPTIQEAMGLIYTSANENADVFFGVNCDSSMSENVLVIEVFAVNAMS